MANIPFLPNHSTSTRYGAIEDVHEDTQEPSIAVASYMGQGAPPTFIRSQIQPFHNLPYIDIPQSLDHYFITSAQSSSTSPPQTQDISPTWNLASNDVNYDSDGIGDLPFDRQFELGTTSEAFQNLILSDTYPINIPIPSSMGIPQSNHSNYDTLTNYNSENWMHNSAQASQTHSHFLSGGMSVEWPLWDPLYSFNSTIDALRVPLRPYRPANGGVVSQRHSLSQPLEFWRGDRLGVLVSEVLATKGRLPDLRNGDVRVFNECKESISIRINWPGFQDWSEQFATFDHKKHRQHVTLSRALFLVARKVSRFFDKVQEGKVQRAPDWADQSLWMIGPNAIRLQDLVLLSLHQTSRGSWQPEVRLHEPLST